MSTRTPAELNKFDVSVITPCFGETEAMLRRNILSVANQKSKYKIQHILVLDKGKPHTALALGKLTAELELDKKLGSSGVIIAINQENKGLPATRNIAMQHAEGEYIMFLDADDAFVEGRVGKQIDFMKKNELDHCYGGYTEILGDDQKPKPDATSVLPPQATALSELKKGINPCFCGSNCVKRSVFNEVGTFDDTMLDGAEDMEMWLRIGRSGLFKVGCQYEVLYYLGLHGNNMTAKYLDQGRFEKAYEYIQKKHGFEFQNI